MLYDSISMKCPEKASIQKAEQWYPRGESRIKYKWAGAKFFIMKN